MTAMITSRQGTQVGRVCEDAAMKSELPRDVIQRALHRGDELQERFVSILRELGDLPFANEEVESKYGYPQGFRFRSPVEKMTAIKSIFPLLEFQLWEASASAANIVLTSRLLHNMEFKAIIPDFRAVAATSQDYRAEMSELEAYCLATNIVVQKLNEMHGEKFHNYRQGTLTPGHLNLTEGLAKAHAQLRATHGKLWVIDAQFGKLHAGRSVRRARVCMQENEFGFGPYEVAILLLTHPDRITGPDQLYVNCAGVEYRPGAAGDFFACLDFYWLNRARQIGLNFLRVQYYYNQFGSVSGVLPPPRS